MIRSALGKVAWVGRTTSMVFGLALILALVFGVATSAMGANGKPFLLGKYNVASAISTLVKQGPGPALKLQVGAGQPPLAVNSKARVANLNAATAGRADSAASAGFATNADKLDGNNSTAFLPSEIYEKSTSKTIAAGSSAGTTAYCDPGDVAVSGSYGMVADGAYYLKVSSERRVDERLDGETGQVNPSGWHVIAMNTGESAERSITVYVNCADQPPLHP